MSSDEHLDPLRDKVSRFPGDSGVYLMKDASATVIYVGKAKDLRARVRTYFSGGDERYQVRFLLQRVRDIDMIVTENEEQAFILERDLIQKYKPKYNIRLKDDRAYLSIRLDDSVEWPRVELVRKIQQDGAYYFGPYSSGYELRELLETIKRVVPLRSCPDTVFHNRARPCLEYQIKRCAGPCCLPVDKEQYRGWVRQAISILEGKSDQLRKDLTAQMERASTELRFEDAAVMRDRIEVLRKTGKVQQLISATGEHRDVFGLYREQSLVSLAILRVRFGRVNDTVNYTLSGVEVDDAEVIEAAVAQFYEGGRDIPDEIIVGTELVHQALLERTLKERRGAAVEIVRPARGIRFRLLNLAAINAQQQFIGEFNAEARYEEIAKGLAKVCSLQQTPRRIECVDISNLQGSDIVGAVVAFSDGEPDKSSYRKYKISQQEKPDDFAAIREVVGRRLARGKEEGGLPDLMVIDGGLGQLHQALAARDEVGVAVEIIGLAKARSVPDLFAKEVASTFERIFLAGSEAPIELKPTDEVTKFLQRLRDEAHRFVITFHRKSRSRRAVKSVLDTIAGVGPDRRRRLFAAFGSVENMKQSAPQDLARAGRMPLSLASKILAVLGGSATGVGAGGVSRGAPSVTSADALLDRVAREETQVKDRQNEPAASDEEKLG